MSENLNLLPVSLKTKTTNERLDELVKLIEQAPENSIILASELCVSGYDFDGFFSRANRAMLGGSIGSFDAILFEALQEALTPDKFLGLTHLTSLNRAKGLAQISITQAQKNEIYNEFILLNSQNVFYTQNKSKLFRPNLEHEIFAAGDESAIKPFDFKGLKIGVLICFELRFAHLWQQLKDCDVILVPAMWGKAREDAYLTLCKALALANSCYVVAASSLDLEFSGIFLPSGEFEKEAKFDSNLILETKRNLGLL
jgi:nitrilase/cyanide hydratase and apolipoprotein N-acyltransferase